MSGLRFCTLLLLAAPLAPAQDLLKEFEKKVTEFTLPNGLHFTVVERHEAPVVSFHTYVNAGSVDDPSGQTGLAHMFEHMAFKGTETIGTKDWPAEKRALDLIEEAYDRLDEERAKGPQANQSRLAYLDAQATKAVDAAERLVQSNEYTRIIEENGGAGLNADTTLDYTEYFYSLPSNRIELWFLLESQRFQHPVFREFYAERQVVQEENRMRVDSSPQGKLLQAFVTTAFAASPYRDPAGGWPSDIASLRRGEAQAFFDRYYVPGNMNIAIVGDVNPAESRRLAERYFGPMAVKPLPPPVHTVEPPQAGPKTAVVEIPTEPLAAIGYKRPGYRDKDDSVFDVISMILSSGRTGLLYKELVDQKKIALQAQAASTFPAGRYNNLFIFFLAPALGHTVDENLAALDDLLARFVAQPVDAETLQRAKNQERAVVIRRMDNNPELAAVLTIYYGAYRDWRRMFTELDDLNKVTAEDVQRVALQYFRETSRTVSYTRIPRGGVRRGPGAAR